MKYNLDDFDVSCEFVQARYDDIINNRLTFVEWLAIYHHLHYCTTCSFDVHWYATGAIECEEYEQLKALNLPEETKDGIPSLKAELVAMCVLNHEFSCSERCGKELHDRWKQRYGTSLKEDQCRMENIVSQLKKLYD